MRLITTIIILVIVVLVGCTGSIKNPCSLSEEVRKELKKEDSLINLPLIKQRNKEWMKWNYDEPSILKAEHESYRFVMGCSGSSDYTKIVRIEKRQNRYIAIIKEFEGATGGPDAKGSLFVFELSKEDWELITNKLDSDNFWTSTASCNESLLHGCIWYLEGYKPIKNECTLQNYHHIGGCYPIDSSFISICELFDNLKQKY